MQIAANMKKLQNVAMEDVAPIVNMKSLENVQEKMQQIAVNMKELRNIAMEDFVSNCAYEELE